MAKLVWDQTGEHLYETGTDHGVVYPQETTGAYEAGAAWNGLTAVTERPSGAEATALYADNIKYLNLISAEDYGVTIEAYTYPKEFEACDGSAEPVSGVKLAQQVRKSFGFAYRTLVGNDTVGNDFGYKLHLVYGAKAQPSERSYATVNDSPEAITFSWEVETTPTPVSYNGVTYKPTAHVEIDSTDFTTTAAAAKLAALEATLFGADAFGATSTYAVGDLVEYTDGTTTSLYKCTTAVETAGAWDASDWTLVGAAGPRLPLPAEVIGMLA